MLFFMFVGAYALGDKFMALPIFTISDVEVKGVNNANRQQLIELGNTLVGMNIFDKKVGLLTSVNDPWVKKLVATRTLPNEVNLIVYEEVPLFTYKSGKKCYIYVQSGKTLEAACEDIHIVAKSDISKINAEKFADLLEKNEFLKDTEITLKADMFEVRYGDETIYSPYDNELFQKNFKVYTDVLKERYKKIEYADLTVDERIFVKGVRSDTK